MRKNFVFVAIHWDKRLLGLFPVSIQGGQLARCDRKHGVKNASRCLEYRLKVKTI